MRMSSLKFEELLKLVKIFTTQLVIGKIKLTLRRLWRPFLHIFVGEAPQTWLTFVIVQKPYHRLVVPLQVCHHEFSTLPPCGSTITETSYSAINQHGSSDNAIHACWQSADLSALKIAWHFTPPQQRWINKTCLILNKAASARWNTSMQKKFKRL